MPERMKSKETKPHSPYIMPDGGKRLVEYLREAYDKPDHRRKNKHSKEGAGWQSGAGGGSSAAGAMLRGEVEALRLGREKRTRYLNDRILRDMAGATTVQQIEALFKPVPFGEVGPETPLQKVLLPENQPLWDAFRSVDPDKQARILEKWEVNLRAHDKRAADLRPGEAAPSSALTAMRRWAGINRRSRDALKAADPEAVDELELPILHFLDKDDEELELTLKPWQRLLVHGMADYHSLHLRKGTLPSPAARPAPSPASSPASGPALVAAAPPARPVGNGTADDGAVPILLRRRPQAGPHVAAANSAAAAGYSMVGKGEGSSDEEGGQEESAQRKGLPKPRNAHEITVADILFALVDHSGGLTPASLAEYVNDHLHPDRHSESEASYVVV